MPIEDSNTFSAVGVKKSNDKLVILNTTNTNNNILYHSTSNNDDVDTLSIKNIINKGDDLNICTYNENTIQPIIQIDNTHKHVNITSNLNVASNLNVTSNVNVTSNAIVGGTLGVTGTTTLNNNVTIAADKNLNMSGTGTLTTGTGDIALNGDVIIAADKNLNMSGTGTLTTGTGAIALNGDVTIAAYKNLNMSGTGTLTTGTGAIALNGDVTIAADKNLNMSGTGTLTTGTGDIALNGDVTIAADKNLNMSGTGTLTTGTGDIALNGDINISTTITSTGKFRGTSTKIKDHIILTDKLSNNWSISTEVDNDNKSYFNLWYNSQKLILQIQENDTTSVGKLIIDGGDGTDANTIPLIVTASYAAGSNYYYKQLNNGRQLGNATFEYKSAQADNVSAKFDHSILLGVSGEVWWYSDLRIKTNISNIPTNTSLEIIKSINCKYYEYIDKTRNTNVQTIGFIAQEVKTQIPKAVSLNTEFVPDVYKVITCIWNNTTMTCDTLTNVNGIKYKFYVSNNSDGSDETEKIVVGNSDNTFTFEQKYNNVFCFGKQVDDFHVLDENKIYKLHHGAIQEIDKIQQQQQTKINTLENKNIELKNKINILEQNYKILEDRLSIIENMLNT